MISYDYAWSVMIIQDQLWLYMISYHYTWSVMIIHDQLWLYMISYDYTWSVIIIDDQLSLYMITYHYRWSVIIIHDHLWLSRGAARSPATVPSRRTPKRKAADKEQCWRCGDQSCARSCGLLRPWFLAVWPPKQGGASSFRAQPSIPSCLSSDRVVAVCQAGTASIVSLM